MLYDATTTYVSQRLPTTQSQDGKRGSKIVTTINPTGTMAQFQQARTAEKRNDSGVQKGSPETEALQFRREESSMHQLYQSTRETVETSRQTKIANLKQAVNNGTYRPNLRVVAERLLSDRGLGRD